MRTFNFHILMDNAKTCTMLQNKNKKKGLKKLKEKDESEYDSESS